MSRSGTIPSHGRCHHLGAQLAGRGQPRGHAGRNILCWLLNKNNMAPNRKHGGGWKGLGRSPESVMLEEKGEMGALAGSSGDVCGASGRRGLGPGSRSHPDWKGRAWG